MTWNETISPFVVYGLILMNRTACAWIRVQITINFFFVLKFEQLKFFMSCLYFAYPYDINDDYIYPSLNPDAVLFISCIILLYSLTCIDMEIFFFIISANFIVFLLLFCMDLFLQTSNCIRRALYFSPFPIMLSFSFGFYFVVRILYHYTDYTERSIRPALSCEL